MSYILYIIAVSQIVIKCYDTHILVCSKTIYTLHTLTWNRSDWTSKYSSSLHLSIYTSFLVWYLLCTVTCIHLAMHHFFFNFMYWCSGTSTNSALSQCIVGNISCLVPIAFHQKQLTIRPLWEYSFQHIMIWANWDAAIDLNAIMA